MPTIDVLYAYLKPTDWLKEPSNAMISKRDFDVSFSSSIYANIKEIKNIELKVLTEDAVSKAIDIREKYDLNIFDSIHAATALLNDKSLKRIDPRTIG